MFVPQLPALPCRFKQSPSLVDLSVDPPSMVVLMIDLVEARRDVAQTIQNKRAIVGVDT